MILSRLLSGCSVGFYGMGESCSALLRSLPLEKCKITLRSDGKISPHFLPEAVKVDRIFDGKDGTRDIDEDLIFFSPSVRRDRPEFIAASKRGVKFSSDCELFLEENKRPIFAVTGSDGKSTTATMIKELLNESGIKVSLIGNIGEPMINGLLSSAELHVAELSSFMLTYARVQAKRACITNITPNHLDWHESYSEYKKTKISLTESSEAFVISEKNSDIKGAFAIVGEESNYEELKRNYSAELYLTKEDGYIKRNGEKILELRDVLLKENHNIKNLMMAIAMTDGYAGLDEIKKMAKSFSGLMHRCQKILSIGGVDYFDSSIDSTPARTCETINSLGRDLVLILGGRGKGIGYSDLKPTVQRYVKYAIIVGENSEEIYEAIHGLTKAEIYTNFEEAVKRGAELAREVGTLLLSPASTSFDLFKNYTERGDKFKQILIKNTSF